MCLTVAVHILNAKKDLIVIFITCTLHCVSSANGYFNPAKFTLMGFQGGSDGKESVHNAEDLGLIPGWGRSPGEGSDNPLQYFCLENPMAEEAGGLLSMESDRATNTRSQLSDYLWVYVINGTTSDLLIDHSEKRGFS